MSDVRRFYVDTNRENGIIVQVVKADEEDAAMSGDDDDCTSCSLPGSDYDALHRDYDRMVQQRNSLRARVERMTAVLSDIANGQCTESGDLVGASWGELLMVKRARQALNKVGNVG